MPRPGIHLRSVHSSNRCASVRGFGSESRVSAACEFGRDPDRRSHNHELCTCDARACDFC